MAIKKGTNASETLRGTSGADSMYGYGGNDILYGYGGNDRLFGGAGNDRLLGGAGNDTLNGGAGNDILNGGAGGDAMIGGDGDDTYYWSGDDDTISELAGGGTDTVRVAQDFHLGSNSNIENGILSGSGDFTLQGNSLRNVLHGNSGDNLIDGWVGNDQLYGRAGEDTLLGWTGRDVIDGGEGDDYLFGEAGNDTLTGGGGADVFGFDSTLNASTNVDEILDFTPADDSFQLAQVCFSEIAVGTLSAGAFRLGTAAADANDRIIYDSATGNIYYDADGSGSGEQVLFAQVDAGTVLTNADFVIVSDAP